MVCQKTIKEMEAVYSGMYRTGEPFTILDYPDMMEGLLMDLTPYMSVEEAKSVINAGAKFVWLVNYKYEEEGYTLLEAAQHYQEI